jgi:hypothetical protein
MEFHRHGGVAQFRKQILNALSSSNPHAKILKIDWFGKKLIDARIRGHDDFIWTWVCAQQHHPELPPSRAAPNFQTNFKPSQTRKGRTQKRHAGCVRFLQALQCGQAVRMYFDGIVQLLQVLSELPAVFQVFLCKKNSAIMHGELALDGHNETSAAVDKT